MANVMTSIITAGACAAAPSAAFTHSTASATKRSHKRTAWPTATKSAFYANFYAVDEATGVLIGENRTVPQGPQIHSMDLEVLFYYLNEKEKIRARLTRER